MIMQEDVQVLKDVSSRILYILLKEGLERSEELVKIGGED